MIYDKLRVNTTRVDTHPLPTSVNAIDQKLAVSEDCFFESNRDPRLRQRQDDEFVSVKISITLLQLSAIGRKTLQHLSNWSPCTVPCRIVPPQRSTPGRSTSSSSAPVSVKRSNSPGFAWLKEMKRNRRGLDTVMKPISFSSRHEAYTMAA